MGYAATPLAVRLERKIERDPNSGCWLWSDAPDIYGYGRLQINNRAVKAHRVSYELHIGKIPTNKFVCHRCDTRSCVNPEHLFLGDANDNNKDMCLKGRNRAGNKPHPGHKNGRAVLNEDQVVEMLLRKARGQRVRPYVEARKLGMHPSGIVRILSGKAWKHIPRAESLLIAMYGRMQG